jgi:hypothetical protein
MQNISYLTPIVDGMPDQFKIPMCIQLHDGRFYCFDHRGRLVSVQNTDIANLDTSVLNTAKVAASISRLISASGSVNFDSGLVFDFQFPILQSSNGLFVNENVPFQGWPSLSIYSGSPTPGTGGTYGSAVTLFSNVNLSPRAMVMPLFLSITWGGTFASGETVSVEVSFTIVYGTNTQNTLGTGIITASATATGTQNFGCKEIYAVIAPYLNSSYNYAGPTSYNQYISQITAQAASSASSTSVTVTVTVVGFHT